MAEIFTNDPVATLAVGMGINDTTLTVVDGSEFPVGPTFRIRIDNELMKVTAVGGNTWTVVRAAEKCLGVQQATVHGVGTTIYGVLTAAALNAVSSGSGVSSFNTRTGDVVFVASDLPASGVTANSYTNANITVDIHGIITAASNGSAGGVTSFNTRTGAVTFLSSDIPDTAVTPGTYTNATITVDQKGRLTFANNGAAATIAIGESVTGTTYDGYLASLGGVLVEAAHWDGTTSTFGPGGGIGSLKIINVGSNSIAHFTSSTGHLTGDIGIGDVRGFGAANSTTGYQVQLVTSTQAISSTGPVQFSSLTGIGSPSAIIIDDLSGNLGDTSSYTNGQIPVAAGGGSITADNRRGFYAGHGAPDPSLGFVSDFYLDEDTGNLYSKS